jgi:hypothetical protein
MAEAPDPGQEHVFAVLGSNLGAKPDVLDAAGTQESDPVALFPEGSGHCLIVLLTGG